VLKLCHHSDAGHQHWLSGADPAHWYYWRREPLAYESGLVASFSGGLRGPHCYVAAEGPGEQVRLWLEDVGARPAPGWPLERYGVAARHLGRAQGAFLVDRPLPDEPWLSRDWLRAYLSQRRENVELLDDPAAWAVPLVARFLPPDLARPLRQLWDDQPRLLEVLDTLPRTLCHLDLHPKNLFDVGGQTVLIDWSFTGLGAIGEDSGNLVWDSVHDFHVRPEDVERLWELVAGGYAAGLADAGWDGEPALVRRAMAVSVVVKYAWVVPVALRAALDGRPLLNGRPIAEALPWWAHGVPFLLEQAELARIGQA
jgi:hypothetical protein